MATSTYTSIDMVRFLLNDCLFEKKPTQWTTEDRLREEKRIQNRQVGTIHVAFSKETISKSIPVQSFQALEEIGGAITHFTTNPYMWGRQYRKKGDETGKRLDNLRSVSTISIETDVAYDPKQVFYAAEELGLPSPCCILRTPSGGLHWFYRLSKPFTGSNKARGYGIAIAKVIKEAFSTILEIDEQASPIGFYRFPHEKDVINFKEETLCSEFALDWAFKSIFTSHFDTLRYKSNQYTIHNNTEGDRYVNSIPYKKMVANKEIKGHKGNLGRNNFFFTLALMYKADRYSQADCEDALYLINDDLKYPLKSGEIHTVIRHAYVGKYRGPANHYIRLFAGTTEGLPNGFYLTPKKPRKNRERSHYDEWADDIQNYLESNTSETEPFKKGSQRDLSSSISNFVDHEHNLSKNSLIDAIEKHPNRFVLKKAKAKDGSVLRGRNAYVLIALRKYVVKLNKQVFNIFVDTINSGTSDAQSISIGKAILVSQELEIAHSKPNSIGDEALFDDPPD